MSKNRRDIQVAKTRTPGMSSAPIEKIMNLIISIIIVEKKRKLL